MTFPIELRGLEVHFGDVRAVDGVTATIGGGTIAGLLGRNGAGKSTLLATVAAFRRPTGGAVLVDGVDPYEDARVMAETCLIRANGDFEASMKVRDILSVGADLRPRWDAGFADRLADRFRLRPRAKAGELSQGQRSALAVTVGLATRAPLTMFDEPHLGMDAPSRYAFYDELLADYIVHPRTFVLSTHLIDEVADLLEDVVILDHGRVLAHEAADDMRARGTEVTGPADAVEDLIAGLRVLSSRRLGNTRAVVVTDPLDPDRLAAASAAGVEVGPIPLQDLFVHLTDTEEAVR
jgi:ABC-2 type transport system ATP-binding protein